MLDRLVASRPVRGRSGSLVSAVVALLVHGGLVTAGVVATLPGARPDPPHVITLPGPIQYVVGPRTQTDARGSLPPPLHWPDPELRDLPLPAPEVELPGVLGVGARWEAPLAGSAAAKSTGLPGIPFPGARGLTPGVVHREATVDEPPVLLTRPALVYPALLRTVGLEGVVILEVIIDSTGVPEPESLRVIAASHPGFAAAAARVVLGARFRPGRMWGQPVRVLIRQPIVFRLSR